MLAYVSSKYYQKSRETFSTTSTFTTSTIYTTTTASTEPSIKTKQTRNPGNMSSAAGPSEAARQILNNLSGGGGVSSLVATTVVDTTTGQTTFMDENGNSLTQEQVDAQNTARAALENVPEITAEDILAESSEDDETEVLVTSNDKPDSPMGGMDGADEGFLIDLTEPNAKKVKKSKASSSKKRKASDDGEDSDDEKTEDEKTSSNEEDSDHDKGGQTSIKTPVTTRRRAVPSTGHRAKRWSETKSWKTILNAELKEQCPTDIDELVRDAVQEVGKPLRSSYKTKIMQLKARGFDDKVAQVAALNKQISTMEGQLENVHVKLEKAQKLIKQLRDGTIKPNVATPAKKKGKQAATSKPAPTDGLDLPPPFEDRPTMTVPMSAMAYAALPDHIVDMGAGMMRATDAEDWPERARNWVILAESRPRFDYK